MALLEGDGISKLTQAIRIAGYNKDTDISFGTVTAGFPNIKITLDDGLPLDTDDLVIAGHLTKHERKLQDGGVIKLDYGLETGDKVIVASVESTQLFVVIDKAVTY